MAKKKKVEQLVPVQPRINGWLADSIKNQCNTYFATTTASEATKVKYNFKTTLDLAPRGEHAKDAFNRDLDQLLLELDNPEDTWDEI